ncbi:MAG: hypothetical protein ACPGNT_04050 [Rhodospirillales bacterium]
MKRFLSAIALSALLVSALAVPSVHAEQKGSAGQPLSLYCNTVPDLSVQRTDQVDNWVRICTVWLAANCGKASGEAGLKPSSFTAVVKEEAGKLGLSR